MRRGRAWPAVPVHGHGDRPLVVLPRGAQVRAGQVGGVEPPGGLQGGRARVRLGRQTRRRSPGLSPPPQASGRPAEGPAGPAGHTAGLLPSSGAGLTLGSHNRAPGPPLPPLPWAHVGPRSGGRRHRPPSCPAWQPAATRGEGPRLPLTPAPAWPDLRSRRLLMVKVT